MLSCFPFPYSSLKDDDYDYSHLFIKQEDQQTQHTNHIKGLNHNQSVISTNSSTVEYKLKNLAKSELSSPQIPTRDNIKLPIPVPRTFRKPHSLLLNSTPVSNTPSNTHSLNSSSKSSLLKLGFHRSKGTEHLQREAIRKSNETHIAALHSQRYIKLPTKSMTSSITNKSNQSYITKYVGCLGINTSMKSLDFDTRSQIAKECINRVCELGRLKTPDKKRRPEKRIHKMLADTPNMEFAGVDVNLVITSSYLHLTTIETGEVIAKHEMPNISFASRGDADTIDFVSYVAKDHRYGRACFVLECGGGLAHDVITAIGQAFELRFKEFLNRSPRTTSVNEILESAVPNGLCHTINNNFNTDNDSKNRLDERDYYNDLPGKIPPDVPPVETNSKTSLRDCSSTQRVPQAAPRTAIKKSNEQNSPNLIDLNIDIQDHINTTQSESSIIDPNTQIVDHQYVNCSTDDSNNNNNQNKTDNSNNESVIQTAKDPFDMKPFNSALAEVTTDPLKANCSQTTTTTTKSTINCKLEQEEWFHGPISRKESETLVVKDGDFLVRESQGSVGQYVLTGMQSGFRKHLLLVDPEGVVRTKDKTFESVSHLINYHRNNGLPIISAESALLLRNPVLVKR